MRIELIVIGGEVLKGTTINTNASFIGKSLHGAGYLLSRQTTLPDDRALLEEGIAEALERADIVLTTGGLGPTIDDITRKTVAALFDSGFHFDKEVADDLAARYGADLKSLTDQATVPSKAKIMLNTVETAPGFIFEQGKGALIMLPGVPHEMKPMLTAKVLPYLRQHFPLREKWFRKELHLFELPENAVDPSLRELKEQHPQVEFGIYPALGLLSVHLEARAEDAQAAEKLLAAPFIKLEEQFATNCFDAPNGLIEEAVHHLFCENGWTLSAAESCTGGSLSARLTALPGASQYFLGSVVSYSNDIKTALLNVPASEIAAHGAVSEAVVARMASGVIAATGSEFGLAVSGIAGPDGGTAEKPVGTVWCAVCRKGEKPHTWQIRARGSRHMIIERSVNALLSNLLIYCKETSLL